MIDKQTNFLNKNAYIHVGIFLCVLILGASACTAPLTRQLEFERPHDLPAQAKIENVPFFPQEAYHCGPSTLAMAMNFYGKQTSPEDVAKDVFIPNRKGSFQVEMKAAVRKRGMLAYELTPELVYLLAEVSVGHPVVVLQNNSIKLYPVWHYAVLIGYDLNAQTVTLHTGAKSSYTLSMHTFEHTWNRADNWALVVLPTNQLPNDRNLKNVLQAAVDLEQVGKIQAANETYQNISKRWPDNLVAVMGAANTFLQLQQPDEATPRYLRALEIKPEKADIYNNLAYSLIRQNCNAAALTSINCAIKLDPSNAEFKDSLQEISAAGNSNQTKNCPTIRCN